MDRARQLAEGAPAPAKAGIGDHRDDRQAGARRQGGHARQQRQGLAEFRPRAFREDDDLPFLPRRPLALSHQHPHRGAAAAPVDRDHPCGHDQLAEQRDPQQFMLQHVAAARQQGQPEPHLGAGRHAGQWQRFAGRVSVAGPVWR